MHDKFILISFKYEIYFLFFGALPCMNDNVGYVHIVSVYLVGKRYRQGHNQEFLLGGGPLC